MRKRGKANNVGKQLVIISPRIISEVILEIEISETGGTPFVF